MNSQVLMNKEDEHFSWSLMCFGFNLFGLFLVWGIPFLFEELNAVNIFVYCIGLILFIGNAFYELSKLNRNGYFNDFALGYAIIIMSYFLFLAFNLHPSALIEKEISYEPFAFTNSSFVVLMVYLIFCLVLLMPIVIAINAWIERAKINDSFKYFYNLNLSKKMAVLKNKNQIERKIPIILLSINLLLIGVTTHKMGSYLIFRSIVIMDMSNYNPVLNRLSSVDNRHYVFRKLDDEKVLVAKKTAPLLINNQYKFIQIRGNEYVGEITEGRIINCIEYGLKFSKKSGEYFDCNRAEIIKYNQIEKKKNG